MKPLKAEQTRAAIFEAALNLILDGGYEKATMRAIAKEAGLSVGAAYYYFASKEHIIQAFYERTTEQFLAGAREVLRRETEFGRRLEGVIKVQFEVSRPFHRVAKVLFKAAVDPKASLSPFSDETKAVRQRGIQIFDEAIRGSSLKTSAPLENRLPALLWLFHMSLVAYWVFDASPEQEKTHKLVERAVPLVARMIRLSGARLAKPVIEAAMPLLLQFEILQRSSPANGMGEKGVKWSGGDR